jgi:SAM-dependent methyltransferase
MALPFPDNRFDAAFMALVIFFVPEPAKGVAEMARVVRPGGTIATYAWDMLGGGFPLEPVHAEFRALGHKVMGPPRPEASRVDDLRQLWTGAGLEAVETRQITVRRSFADFDEFWAITCLSGALGPMIAAMPPGEVDQIKQRVRAKVPSDTAGRITYGAFANAVKGRVPE